MKKDLRLSESSVVLGDHSLAPAPQMEGPLHSDEVAWSPLEALHS